MDDEKVASHMLDQLNPYEPTAEVWQGIERFINKITKEHQRLYVKIESKLVTHETKPSILEVFEPVFFKDYPLTQAVLVLCFALRQRPDDADGILEGAMLLLDANRKAYAFSPTGNTSSF